MRTVQVETEVLGGIRADPGGHVLSLAIPSGPTPLRVLIEAVVRTEVAAFSTRSADDTLLRLLTDTALAAGRSTGTIRSGGREATTTPDVDEAVRTAIQAHRDGLVQVIVDQRPVDDLDAEIDLRDGAHVLFVRLVALTGG